MAAMARWRRSQLSPLRAVPFLDLPADSCCPGHMPAHEARWPGVANLVMSTPISPMMASAIRRSTPGIVHNRSRGISQRGDALVDRQGEPADGLVGVVELAQNLGHQDGMGGSETTFEGRAELGQLLAQQPLGQIGQDFGILGAGDQRHEHGPPRSSQDVRSHRREFDAGILEHLVEPLGVTHIGLATRDVTHVAGVQEPAVELVFEHVEHRLPIDAGRLHAHPGDTQVHQPVA